MGNYFKVPDGAKTNKKFVKFFRKCNIHQNHLTFYRETSRSLRML